MPMQYAAPTETCYKLPTCTTLVLITVLLLLLQANPPARAGGPVTCFNNEACRLQRAWMAATAVGSTATAPWATLTGCSGYVCVDLNVK
jgi:hypothetical protein